MSLLGSTSRAGASSGVRPVTVSVTDGDLGRCDAALRRFEDSYGGGQDAPIRSALMGIAEAGGWRGDEWALEEYAAGRDVDTQAWRWLALITEAAATVDPALAGRVGFFFRVFWRDIGPNLSMADHFDFGLGQPPEAVYRSALVHAIKALGPMAPDAIVLRYPQGQFDVGGMIFLLGESLGELQNAGTRDEDEARAIASSVAEHARGRQQQAASASNETLGLRLRSLQTAHRRATAEPDRLDYQRTLAAAYDALGDAQRALGMRDEALGSYASRLQVTARLAAGEPERLDYQRNLAAAHEELGEAQRALGESHEALDSYTRSLQITQRLVSTEPERIDYQRRLARAHGRLGDTSRGMGDGAAADAHYAAELRIARRVLALQPESANAIVDLAEVLRRSELVHKDAQPRAAEAVALLEQLESQGRLNKRGAAVLAQMR